MSGDRSGEPRSRKGRVTATDNADADAILDVLEGHVYGASIEDGAREIAKVAIAKLLADKREEWLLCAMVRVEREFRVKRLSPSGSTSE